MCKAFFNDVEGSISVDGLEGHNFLTTMLETERISILAGDLLDDLLYTIY